ncbi:flagellar basal body P-ring formation chaperone FlgA [Zavarzinia sp.]|uniref:flagellar basal body P-ring formation chaperone FlgA n=1 Tax=Zavarzinia sp. TaxID=2027920 RepID=UPI0035686B5B
MIRFAIGILLWALAWSLGLPAKAQEAAPAAVTATIPVLDHDLAPGDVLRAEDLVDQPVQGALPGNIATDADQLVGLAARKPLRAGRPIALSEVRPPVLVGKGSLVTLRVSLPGIELATTAKAIEQGAMGDAIRVMNLTSNRIVQAVVTGTGEAQVLVAAQPVTDAAPQM